MLSASIYAMIGPALKISAGPAMIVFPARSQRPLMMRVLIVDDQPAFRSHLRQLVARAGMVVLGEAADIPAAEQLISQECPDLAFVDLVLPGINGLEGTRRLKARAPGLKVYLISAHRDQARQIEALAKKAGAEAFFPKENLDLALLQSLGIADLR